MPHFLGLHAFQALPLLALATRRRGWAEPRRVRVTVAAATSYAGLFALMLLEAMRGYSLVNPDRLTLLAGAAWLVLSVAAAWIAANHVNTSRTPAAH